MNAKRLFLAVVGCGVVAGIVALVFAAPEPHLPAATYAGPLTTTVEYDHGGITLTAPSKATAAVSWADAYTTGCTTGAAICGLDQSPTIFLANATVTSAGRAQSDGRLTPLLANTLVYVLRWTNVPCSPAGPPPSPGSTADPRPDGSCTVIDLIDAGTGRVLYSVEGPDIS
jgi:hypothetical protein